MAVGPYHNTTYGKIAHFSKIFIKSAIDQTNLKLGVMITWVNSNTLKMFTAIAICLEGTDS